MIQIRSTVIYDDVATELSAQSQAGQLWIESGDLSRATRFELKPRGVCRGELCYPLPPSRQSEFVQEQSGKSWFNLTAFARLMSQPVAHDAAHSRLVFRSALRSAPAIVLIASAGLHPSRYRRETAFAL